MTMDNRLRGENHPRAKHSDEFVENARRMRDRGWKIQDLAKELGVRYWTMVDWLGYRTR